MVFLTCLILKYKYEPIDYLIKNGKDEDAVKQIDMLYKQSKSTNDDSSVEVFTKYIKQRREELEAAESSAITITFKEALFGREYWRSTWTALGVCVCV